MTLQEIFNTLEALIPEVPIEERNCFPFVIKQIKYCFEAKLNFSKAFAEFDSITLVYKGNNPSKELHLSFSEDGGAYKFVNGEFAGGFSHRTGPEDWKVWLNNE